MAWFRRARQSALTPEQDAELYDLASASVHFSRIVDEVVRTAPPGYVTEDLRAALVGFDLDEFASRLSRHREIAERANAGDADAAMEFLRLANVEVADMLRSAGHDVSHFELNQKRYESAR